RSSPKPSVRNKAVITQSVRRQIGESRIWIFQFDPLRGVVML
ncbi:hypothetical protein HMPREF0496_1827, partial [Lentilactobacillus hilgardii ATCC 27305]